jgi:hypothetical protein
MRGSRFVGSRSWHTQHGAIRAIQVSVLLRTLHVVVGPYDRQLPPAGVTGGTSDQLWRNRSLHTPAGRAPWTRSESALAATASSAWRLVHTHMLCHLAAPRVRCVQWDTHWDCHTRHILSCAVTTYMHDLGHAADAHCTIAICTNQATPHPG